MWSLIFRTVDIGLDETINYQRSQYSIFYFFFRQFSLHIWLIEFPSWDRPIFCPAGAVQFNMFSSGLATIVVGGTWSMSDTARLIQQINPISTSKLTQRAAEASLFFHKLPSDVALLSNIAEIAWPLSLLETTIIHFMNEAYITLFISGMITCRYLQKLRFK